MRWKWLGKYVAGGLRGVHVSSIGNWGYQGNFKPVYFFFLRKDFTHTKSTKPNKNDFYLLEVFVRKKLQPLLFFVCLFLFCYFVFACECFCCFLVAYFCFDSFFLLVSVFVRVKSFCKNKLNKQAENCLDSLNYLYYSRTSAYRIVKIVRFLENLACFVFFVTSVLRLDLLLCYRRYVKTT